MRSVFSVLGGLVACAASISLAAPGCSSSSTNTGLTVNSVSAPASVASSSAPSGRYFVELNVTLTNPGSAAIPAWFYYYDLITEQGITVSPSLTVNAEVGTPCSNDISVGPQFGATVPSYTCNLVFEVPCGQTVADLVYDGGSGALAVINDPPASPSTCSSGAGTGGGDGGA